LALLNQDAIPTHLPTGQHHSFIQPLAEFERANQVACHKLCFQHLTYLLHLAELERKSKLNKGMIHSGQIFRVRD
jgi:hypothetical protein